MSELDHKVVVTCHTRTEAESVTKSQLKPTFLHISQLPFVSSSVEILRFLYFQMDFAEVSEQYMRLIMPLTKSLQKVPAGVSARPNSTEQVR
jgi:hypothetical protein